MLKIWPTKCDKILLTKGIPICYKIFLAKHLSSPQCNTLKWDGWVRYCNRISTLLPNQAILSSTILLNPLITDFNTCSIRNRQDKAKTSRVWYYLVTDSASNFIYVLRDKANYRGKHIIPRSTTEHYFRKHTEGR